MPKYIKEIEEGRRSDGQVHAERAERADARQPGDGFRLDRLQGICRQARCRRQHGRRSRQASRHRPVHRSSTTSSTPSSAIRPSPTTGRARQPIDDLIFAITPDPTARAQKLQAGECDIMPYPNPADIAGAEGRPQPHRHRAGRPQHRLHVLQRDRAAVRQRATCARRSTWRSTSTRSSKRSSRVPARPPRT